MVIRGAAISVLTYLGRVLKYEDSSRYLTGSLATQLILTYSTRFFDNTAEINNIFHKVL